MSFTVPRTRPAQRARGDRAGRGRGRDQRRPRRSRDGQGLGRRRRHEVPPGRRRARLLDARRPGHQHRDDLDVPDQDLVRRQRRRRGHRRPCPARGVRPRRGPDRDRAPLRSTQHEPVPSRSRGRHRRRGHRHARQAQGARLPGRGDRPVRLRALRGQATRRRHDPRARRRHDPGLRHRALQRRRDARAARGRRSSSTRARSWWTTRPPSAATPRSRSWSPRSTPRRWTATRA